jgi:hypothetical protein
MSRAEYRGAALRAHLLFILRLRQFVEQIPMHGPPRSLATLVTFIDSDGRSAPLKRRNEQSLSLFTCR